MESGVAKKPIKNWEKYELELMERLGFNNKLETLQIKPKEILKKLFLLRLIIIKF